MIAATGNNNQIGLNNKLLWHIPEDLKNFKEITKHKAIVMGRKTFDSIGKALPYRINIVLTRDKSFKRPGVIVVHEPLDILKLDIEEIVVIGGEEIYKIFLPYAEKIYLSKVDYNGPADTFFPALDVNWEEVSRKEFNDFKFAIFKRIKS